jgi:hypothetical protein
MCQLTIHHSFHPFSVLLVVAMSAIMCLQLAMFPTRIPSTAMAAGAFITCTHFKTPFKSPEFSGIVVSD